MEKCLVRIMVQECRWIAIETRRGTSQRVCVCGFSTAIINDCHAPSHWNTYDHTTTVTAKYFIRSAGHKGPSQSQTGSCMLRNE